MPIATLTIAKTNEASEIVEHIAVTGDNVIRRFLQRLPVLLEPNRNHQPVNTYPESAHKTRPLVFWGLGKRNLLNDFELPVPRHTRSSVDQGKLMSSFTQPVFLLTAKESAVKSQADKTVSWSILKVPNVQLNAQKHRETFECICLPDSKHHAFTETPVAVGTSRTEPQANSSVAHNNFQPLQFDGRSPISIGFPQVNIPPAGADIVPESIEIRVEPEDSNTEIHVDPSDGDRALSACPGEAISPESVVVKPGNDALSGKNLIFLAATTKLVKRGRSPSLDPGSCTANKRQRAGLAQLSAATQGQHGSMVGEAYSSAVTHRRFQYPSHSFPIPPPLNDPFGNRACPTPLQSALAGSRIPTNIALQVVSQPLVNSSVEGAQAPVQNYPASTRPLGHVHTFGHVNRRKKGKSYWAFSLPHQAMIRSGGGVPPPEYIAPVAIYHNFFSNAPPKNMDLSHITIPMTARRS
jgi:hypothetical protein